MATLDVADVLLQLQKEGVVSDQPNTLMEVSLGMLYLYTCADSLAALQVCAKSVLLHVDT
jgi:hypothetical protein